MICKNCGSTVEDGVKFCTKCGERMDEVAEAVQETAEAVQETAEAAQETVEATQEAAAEAKEEAAEVKEKVADVAEDVKETVANVTNEVKEAMEGAAEKVKKLPKTAIIVVAAIALVLIVVLANFKSVTNSVNKLVSSPEKYYASVEKNQIKELAGSFADTYDNNVLENLDFNNYSVDYEIEVELGEDARELIETYLEVDDTEAFKKMAASFFISLKNNVFSGEASATLGKNKLISANAVVDMDKCEAYAQIPELSDKYIGINFEEYVEDFAEEFALVMEQSDALTDAFPKAKTVEKLINKYLTIAVNNVGSVKEDKGTIKVGDIEQKCTTIRIRIKAEDMINIAKAVLEEAKEDKDLHNIIIDFVNAVAEMSEDEMEMDGEDVIDMFVEEIESFLDELEELEDEDYDSEEEIVMNLWVDGEGEVIGREVKVNDETLFSYKMAQKGSKFEFKASVYSNTYEYDYDTYEYEDIEQEITFEGAGKKNSSSLSGEFTLKMKKGDESLKLLEVVVDDFKTKKAKEGYLDGSFTFSLSRDLLQEAGAGLASTMISNYQLKLDIKTGKDAADLAVSVLDDDELFAKVALSTKIGNGKSAKLPKGILVEDQEDIMEWAETIDTEKFLKKIEKSGLPVEIVEEIEDACDQLEKMLDE